MEVQRTFLGLLYIVSDLLNIGVLQRDPQRPNNMLVYMSASQEYAEGWYSQNIHEAVSDLFHDEEGMQIVLDAAREHNIDVDEHFRDAYVLLHPEVL